MSKITVAFIKAALIYFVLAMLLGIHMSRTGVVYPSLPIHVHFNMLGWISMMIYGVAYHILPRFSGQPLWNEKLAKWHFWLANIGLIGMVLGWILISAPGGGTVLYIFALVEGVSVILFALNMFNTVKAAPATPPRPPVRPRPTPPIKAPPTPAAPKIEAKAETETPSATPAKAKKRPAAKPKKKTKPAEKKSVKAETKTEAPKEAAPMRASATTIELVEAKGPKVEEVKAEEPKTEASPVAESVNAEPEAKPEQAEPSSAEETEKKPETETTETGEKPGPE